MSAVAQQMLLVSGSAPATIAYQGAYIPTIAGLVATQTGANFGAIASGRLVIVAIHWVATVSASVLASATIGGVPVPTIIPGIRIGPNVSGNFLYIAHVAAFVPTGTSGTVIATFTGGGAIGAYFFVHSATNILNAAPFGTGMITAGPVPMVTPCNLQAGGVVVAAVSALSTTTPSSFSGITKVYETSPVGTFSGADAITPTAISGASIQMSDPGGPAAGFRTMLVASFR